VLPNINHKFHFAELTIASPVSNRSILPTILFILNKKMLMSDFSQSILKLNKNVDWIKTQQDNFIGGYQPAQKWLKDRKGRVLSYDDIQHYQKIIVALAETDRLMKEIDKFEIN
jgi:hypothetical protein